MQKQQFRFDAPHAIDRGADVKPAAPKWSSAEQLVRECNIRLGEDARALLDENQSPLAYFDALTAAGNQAEARRVMAHQLPKRRALWWAALSAWDVLNRCNSPDDSRTLVRTVTEFVGCPTEASLQAVADANKSVPRTTLLDTLVKSVFASRGRVWWKGAAESAAPPLYFGALIETTVYFASVAPDSRLYRERLHAYALLGRELSQGPPPWECASPMIEVDKFQTAKAKI